MKAKLKNYFIAQRNFVPAHLLAYASWGDSNSKALFCLHGLARNGRDFDYLARSLAQYYYVICPDLPGRGRSDWFIDPKFYNYYQYIDDILALAKKLNITKADFIGSSMGGLISILLAALEPNFIDQLVLNDIGPLIDKNPLRRIAKYVGKQPRFTNLTQATAHLKIMLAHFGINNEQHWHNLTLTSVMRNQDNQLILAYDPNIVVMFGANNIDQITNFDITNEWQAAKFNRLLIIRGQKSDILSSELANWMLTSKANSSLVEFENIGHTPALMDEKQIKVIKDWLINKH